MGKQFINNCIVIGDYEKGLSNEKYKSNIKRRYGIRV